MNEKTATIIGATGLIGSHLLELLQNDNYFNTIKVLVRRPVSFNHLKVKVITIDFSDHEAFKTAIAGSDTVFCAVGTTNKKVKGDKAAYRKVDYDIPVNAAKYCAETGCQNFALVSSVGANSKSRGFYIRLKGEVEEVISHMNIKTISVFRPSLLLGERQEFRFGELMGKIIIKPFSFLFPSKFKPIKASYVAKSMLLASKKELPGFQLYHFKEMKRLISK
jgi:uncharacterized protein YbjT (DUF2867 family)